MILVTGGTGLVGAHLLFDLARSGKPVRALKRSTSSLTSIRRIFEHYAPGQSLFDQIEWVTGDVLDISSLEDAMGGVDYVYHSAAKVSFNPKKRERIMKINAEGTANVVNASLAKGVKKLCHVSSTAAVGKTVNGSLVNESTPWIVSKRLSNYAVSKYLAEQEVWRASAEGLEVVIVNPCIVVGPGQWGKSSTGIFTQIWKGLRFYPIGSNAYVDARDVSTAMIHLMESDIVRERFLIVGENRDFKSFFNLIADGLGKRRPSMKATPWMGAIAWRIMKLFGSLSGVVAPITRETVQAANSNAGFSNKKIKDAIGMRFIPLEQSVKDTCKVFLKTDGDYRFNSACFRLSSLRACSYISANSFG